jgi:hypothetical protein
VSPDIAGYKANHFLPAVREVLDRLLADHGFSYAGDHRGVSAYWVADGQFFRSDELTKDDETRTRPPAHGRGQCRPRGSLAPLAPGCIRRRSR